MIPVLRGKVQDGKLKLDAPQNYLVELSRLEGQRIELTIRKERRTRSLSQNKYYWGVIIEILSDYFGYEKEEMHEELKRKFNPKPSKIDYDKTYGASTTKMSVAEFGEYLEQIITWASVEYQITIPSADGIEL